MTHLLPAAIATLLMLLAGMNRKRLSFGAVRCPVCRAPQSRCTCRRRRYDVVA